MREGEFEVLGDELLDVGPADIVRLLDFDHLQDLSWSQHLQTTRNISKVERRTYVNRPEPRTMSTGHILVHGLHGVAARHLAVLLVHVVRAGAGVVAQPDAEVLHLLRLLLVDLRRHH